MTREDFNNKIMLSFTKYRNEMLTHSAENLFAKSYDITKMTSLKDYLTEGDYRIEELMDYADKLLDDLYEYEWNYDSAMWVNWDDMIYVIDDYLNDKCREQEGE